MLMALAALRTSGFGQAGEVVTALDTETLFLPTLPAARRTSCERIKRACSEKNYPEPRGRTKADDAAYCADVHLLAVFISTAAV